MPHFLLFCFSEFRDYFFFTRGSYSGYRSDEANDPELSSADFKAQGEYDGKVTTYDASRSRLAFR